MNFLSKEYLPNSEKRIEYLRRIVNGRPVAILAAGPSIKELEKRISKLHHADICYLGLNSFTVQETPILEQIGKHLSIVMCSSREGIPRAMKDIVDFLNRDEDNMFVSSFWRNTFELMDRDFDLNQFLSKYNRKLIFFDLSWGRTVPNSDHPLHFIVSNSLLLLIQMAVIGKASRIVLFGADGGCVKNVKEWYYRQEDSGHRGSATGEYIVSPPENLINDTNRYFNSIAPIAIRNIYKTYNLVPIDILNCSDNSFYTPFPKVSYDDAFEYLLTDKKFNKKSDLRVPKVSAILPFVNRGELVKETVESISNQSYSNHEHIIVYNEADDKTRGLEQQFPHIRWFLEKNCNHLQAFKKGISIARGEYIFHCRIGNGYLNHDWFNTCVEVLENNQDISLVWGLSQYLLEDGALGRVADAHFFENSPSQGKEFIYYWLKKKILFPEGNFCVRKKVLEECFSFHDSKASDEREAWIAFNYRFNTSGYLPYFFPIVANYFMGQNDTKIRRQSTDSSLRKRVKAYREDIEQYKRKLIRKKITHHYRNGSGELFSGGFNRGIFLFFNIYRYVKAKLPYVWLLVFDKVLNYWKKYRWSVFKKGTVKVWRRLIKS